MLYKSSYADFQVLARSESVQYHPATGVEIARIKPLTANFGSHGGEFDAISPITGEMGKHALIFGHYFDSESAAEQLGWSEEERESVEATLDKLARDQPYLLSKVELIVPTPDLPWATYDETDWREIPDLAIKLGLAEKVLLYERDNKNRTSIVEALEASLVRAPEPVASAAGLITL